MVAIGGPALHDTGQYPQRKGPGAGAPGPEKCQEEGKP